MRFFKSIMILMCLCAYLFVGGVLIILALDLFSFEQLSNYLKFAYDDPNVKLTVGVIGVLFVSIGILSTRIHFSKLKREKTISFENPDGQVVVSLAAIEDYIKRIVKQMPLVKELKSTVMANRKGIQVISKASLLSDANIPEVTEKIQNTIKTKLLEMLGIEESIVVKIHVGKLIHKGSKEDIEEDPEVSRHLPFRGME